MHLEILTPEKKIFEGEVHSITLPGTDGFFQLLDNHAPLLALLKNGVVGYKTNDAEASVKITGGMVKTIKNRTMILADGLVE